MIATATLAARPAPCRNILPQFARNLAASHLRPVYRHQHKAEHNLPTPPTLPHTRLRRLDCLRGLAAFAVVLFHYTVQYPKIVNGGVAPFTFSAGSYGVHLFFMISGFVILMSIAERGGAHFVRSRFIRLYPVFWAALLLTTAVLTLEPLLGPPPGLVQILANLTMLEQFAHIEPIDGAYWSLTYELGFYIMLFVIYTTRLRRFIGWLPAWMALGGMMFPFIAPLIPHPLHLILGLNNYSHLFAAGLALYLARKDGFSASIWAVLALVPLVQWQHDGPLGALLIAGGVLAMIWGTAPGRDVPRLLTRLTFLGAISYALYLMHQMIGFVILARLQEAGLEAWPALLATVAMALMLATALTFGIEKPSARWLGRMLPQAVRRGEDGANQAASQT